jgi:GH18 family chitinase
LGALVKEMRAAFDATSEKFRVTVAIPLGPWGHQYYDLDTIGKHAHLLNVMAYDLSGGWMNPKKVDGHTSLNTIKTSIALLKESVASDKLVLGLASYGRGFELAHATCTKVQSPFKGLSKPAPCSREAGLWTVDEIMDAKNENRVVKEAYAPENAFKYAVIDGNQWVGYDDQVTLAAKMSFAQEQCLGGFMVWSVDFDVKAQVVKKAYEIASGQASSGRKLSSGTAAKSP